MFCKVILVCSGLMAVSPISFSLDPETNEIPSAGHAYHPLNSESAREVIDFAIPIRAEEENDVRQILGGNQPPQFTPLQMQAPVLHVQGDMWISVRRNIRYIVGGISAITMSSILLVWGAEFRFGSHRR